MIQKLKWDKVKEEREKKKAQVFKLKEKVKKL